MSRGRQTESVLKVAMRYMSSGVIFTVLGPGIFWSAYPMGPIVAAVLAETVSHTIRYFTFKCYVFAADKGYRVTLSRYFRATAPVSVLVFITVLMLESALPRGALTAAVTLVGVTTGFAWSKYVYRTKEDISKSFQGNNRTR